MRTARKQYLLGVGVNSTSYEEVCMMCRNWVEQARLRKPDTAPEQGRYVCVTSVHGIMTARSDHAFRQTLNQADLATPDGMPVVWALRSFGCHRQQRVYGPTLMLALCEQAARLDHRVFLYGTRQETLEVLYRNLLAQFPTLAIVGMYAPPFRPLTVEEDKEVISRILASGADLVFVGISTPKQEYWMAAHKTALPGKVMLGVGAAFDFHAGQVSQAPSWMQRNGLEWFYRLLMEPRRLWHRYLLQTPMFLPLWFLQLAGMLCRGREKTRD